MSVSVNAGVGAAPSVSGCANSATRRLRRGYMPGADCRVTVVRNALAAEGHPRSTAMILGLSGALCFAYEPPGGRLALHTVVGVSDQVVGGVAAALDAYVYAGTDADPGALDAWRPATSAIGAHLRAGYPVHTALHRPTLRAAQHGTAITSGDARFDVGRHYVTITAYDDDRGTVTVFETDAAEPFVVAASDFAAAWFRDLHDPRPFADPTQRCDGSWFSLRAAGDPAPLLGTALVHAIQRVTHAFFAPPMANVGRPALDAFAAAAANWPDDFEHDDAIGPSLLFLPILEGALTGGGFGRKYYGRFLNEAATALGTPSLREGARLVGEAARRWTLLTAALRDAVRPTLAGGSWVYPVDAARLRAAIDAHLGAAVDAERAQMAWLRDWSAAPPAAAEAA